MQGEMVTITVPLEAMDQVVRYLYDEEEQDFLSYPPEDRPRDHIFLYVKTLAEAAEVPS
jgi:hypothetical protein